MSIALCYFIGEQVLNEQLLSLTVDNNKNINKIACVIQ